VTYATKGSLANHQPQPRWRLSPCCRLAQRNRQAGRDRRPRQDAQTHTRLWGWVPATISPLDHGDPLTPEQRQAYEKSQGANPQVKNPLPNARSGDGKSPAFVGGDGFFNAQTYCDVMRDRWVVSYLQEHGGSYYLDIAISVSDSPTQPIPGGQYYIY
jgi:hypothetical protein